MILLLIIPAWTLLILLVVGLCAGARLGDLAQAGPAQEPAPLPILHDAQRRTPADRDARTPIELAA